jgi:hypothetical protein
MTLETIATLSDDATVSLPPWQTDITGQTAGERNDAARSYTTPWGTIFPPNPGDYNSSFAASSCVRALQWS